MKSVRESQVPCVLCLFAQLCLTLCDPMDCGPPGSSVHGDSPGRNTRVGCQALLQVNLPNPGIEPRSPALQADSLPSEPPGEPKYHVISPPCGILKKDTNELIYKTEIDSQT